MARKTLIQVRRDTAANWTSTNPTLSAGEPGFETDTGKVKFGDGSTAWNSLAYFGGAVSSVFTRTGAVVAADGDYYGVVAAHLTGATQASRYVGATTSGSPGSGTFVIGDFVIDRSGAIWICTTAGSPGTWTQVGGAGAVSSVFGRTGAVVAVTGDYYGAVAAALTGATSASRYVGATTSGAPGSGTFSTGDFIIARDGHIYICTSGGSPGTWIDAGAYGGPPSGSASGDLAGSYPGPTVAAIHETTGPTKLTIGSVPDGDYLKRSGSTLIGATAAATPGATSLVYRYTVTGSDKVSIDTGVDTPDAGSNDWANGDLLEAFLYVRTDEALGISSLNINVNNDSSAIYDREFFGVLNTTVSGSPTIGGTTWTIGRCAGASDAAGVFSNMVLTFPNYAGTVGNKVGSLLAGLPEQTAANANNLMITVGYRSTTALSRMAITPTTAGKKLKVGSQLLIYKRLAS